MKIDKEKKKVKLSLRAGEIFDVLRKRELDGLVLMVVDFRLLLLICASCHGTSGFTHQVLPFPMSRSDTRALWRPEYGAFMLEATPFAPYGGSMKEFLCVEASMRLRYWGRLHPFLLSLNLFICLSS